MIDISEIETIVEELLYSDISETTVQKGRYTIYYKYINNDYKITVSIDDDKLFSITPETVFEKESDKEILIKFQERLEILNLALHLDDVKSVKGRYPKQATNGLLYKFADEENINTYYITQNDTEWSVYRNDKEIYYGGTVVYCKYKLLEYLYNHPVTQDSNNKLVKDMLYVKAINTHGVGEKRATEFSNNYNTVRSLEELKNETTRKYERKIYDSITEGDIAELLV